MREEPSTPLSDSDLSVLSNVSTLSSDPGHSVGRGHGESDEEDEDGRNNRASATSKVLRSASAVTKRGTKKSNKSKQPKVSKAAVKEEPLYCTCRKGYDGKAFMIACDGCQEWFHGRCVGVKPKSVIDHYFCLRCTENIEKAKATKMTKATKTATPSPKAAANKPKGKPKKKAKPPKGRKPSKPVSDPPEVAKATTVEPPLNSKIDMAGDAKEEDDDKEDLDDICPICEFECTCGAAAAQLDHAVLQTPDERDTLPGSMSIEANADGEDHHTGVIERCGPSAETGRKPKGKQKAKQPTGRKGRNKRAQRPLDIENEDDAAVDNPVENVVTSYSSPGSENEDEDDLLLCNDVDTVSSVVDSISEAYSSSIHIDSGDDQDIELEEERAIINEMEAHQDELYEIDELSDDYSVYDSVDDSNYDFSEDEDQEIRDYYINAPWSSSEDEEDIDQFDQEQEDEDEPSVTVYGNSLFDGIAAAFLQILAPLANAGEASLAPGSDADLSATTMDMTAFGLASFTAEQAITDTDGTSQHPAAADISRRPSLPSSAVIAHSHTRDEMALDLDGLSLLVPGTSFPLPLPKEGEPAVPTTEGMNDLSALTSMLTTSLGTDGSDSMPPMHISQADAKLQDQLLDMLKMADFSGGDSFTDAGSSLSAAQGSNGIDSSAIAEAAHAINQMLCAPGENGLDTLDFPSTSSLSSPLTLTPSLSTESLKRRNSSDALMTGKRPRTLSCTTQRAPGDPPTSLATDPDAPPPSSPLSRAESEPIPVSMDELVDTSQLYTRSSSRSPSPDPDDADTRFSHDLSRWQRVPIGAFRLLRSKNTNKLWLDR